MNVAVVVSQADSAAVLCRWGWWIARAVEARLTVLWLPPAGVEPGTEIRPAEQLPSGLSDELAAICAELTPPARLSRAPAPADADQPHVLPDPDLAVRALDAGRPLKEVLRCLGETDARYVIVAAPETRGDSLARRLFTDAHCHTLLIRIGGSEARQCGRILVPTAGGPHAEIGLRLGERLAGAEGGKLTALFVKPEGGELPNRVGARFLEKTLAAIGLAGSPWVEPRVVVSRNAPSAIAEVAAEEHDLLILGASGVGSLRRLLFGTVSGKLLAGARGLTVAVVRRRWRLLHQMRRRMGQLLDLTVPQVSRDERVQLYHHLESGSAWRFDFMLLIAVSTAIATLGLLENSAAVVIGAMLVAPLMTPILGAGLALVQGNFPLLRRSTKAILLGYAVALLIGLVIGLLLPLSRLTSELGARGRPNLLDMAIGFLAGLAAAHCLARPGLVAALPGVAIAAALVPPIATTGVSLAWGEWANARGSALLFGTNVVAIVLGAAISLYGGGIRGPEGGRGQRRWVRLTFAALLLVLLVLAFPLSFGLSSLLGQPAPRVPRQVATSLDEYFAPRGQMLEDLRLRQHGDATIVDVEVTSSRVLEAPAIDAIARRVRAVMGPDQRVSVATRLVVEAERKPEGPP